MLSHFKCHAVLLFLSSQTTPFDSKINNLFVEEMLEAG